MAVSFIIINKYCRNLLRISVKARFINYINRITTVLQILLSM